MPLRLETSQPAARLAWAVLAIWLTGCQETPPPLFRDVAASAGVDFRHVTGADGRYFFPEIMSAGVALLDYDADGDMDLYLVQSGRLDDANRPGDRLFRNELAESGELAFTDVTDASGIRATEYGSGVAAGDIDNDGWVDLLVTNFGENQLWRNNGDGTFSEIAAGTPVADGRWSTSASFLDFDRDGWLDLYVANYVDFSINSPTCTSASGRTDYCGPHNFVPSADALYHNRGGGRFEDVSLTSGIGIGRSAGLGVIASDLNGDGWLDLYVANDRMRNHLWLNRGNGRFEDTAMVAGVAVNVNGMPEASMGVDVGDANGDGLLDVFMTHLLGETNTLYLNHGDGRFHDVSSELGLGASSLPYTGFGTALFDYDSDGWLDLAVVNGAVRLYTSQLAAGDRFPYREPNQLFRNVAGRFEDVSMRAGSFQEPAVSRGLALGDLDNDGHPDMVVTNGGGPAQVFRNTHHSNAWIGVRLVTAAGRDGYGALATLQRAGAMPLVRQVRADGSYLSANDPRIVFGLGAEPGPANLLVRWAEGGCERWTDLQPGRYHTLEAGTGESTACD